MANQEAKREKSLANKTTGYFQSADYNNKYLSLQG